MKRKQAGIGLSGLLIAAVVLALAGLLGMKIVPEVIEYYQIVGAVKKVANDPAAAVSVAAARQAFDRQATVDSITAITAADLEIYKEGDINVGDRTMNEKLVIAFAYDRRIRLFGNVSLLIEFQGSSKG